MTKQEVYKQMNDKKRDRVINHLRLLKIYGPAKGLNQREWDSVEIKVKGSSHAGYANNRLWNHEIHENVWPLQIKYDW